MINNTRHSDPPAGGEESRPYYHIPTGSFPRFNRGQDDICQGGFTLVEIIIVGFVFIILFTLASLTLLNVKHKINLASTVNTLINDLKSQQLKAMMADTEGRQERDTYGIYFGTDSYTHFHGTYSAADPANLVVPLGEQIQFSSISFPGRELNFAIGSGEIIGVVSANTIVIQNVLSGEQKTMTINKYGVVTNVN